MVRNRAKVVVDTNIFIYGWFEDNPSCDKILDMIDNRDIQLFFSQDTIGELVYITKNFARYNLRKTEEKIAALQAIMILFYYGTSVNTLDTECPKLNDPQDEKFLKCAIKGEADYLITDDFKHGMQDFGTTKIVSSEEFVNLFNQRN